MRFHFEHVVRFPREILFRFFENPERLEVLHAGGSRVRVLAHETQLRVGAETWIEFTLAGCLPVVLGFRHTLFEAPFRFAEQAIHGPFSKFIHLHEFEPRADGTLVRDSLEVRLPWYYGGESGVRHLLARYISNAFQHRAETLDQLVREGTMKQFTEHLEIPGRT
jgi:ligand-binding SRPBCC domain-containing protein